MSKPTGTPPSTRAVIFPEVQALRAAAVVGVVLYHLWPGIVPGGYAGVDVFFVISGFLITAHLMREVAATGGLRLATFYARRARRLLPAALLVIAATGIATLVLLPQRDWTQVFRELGASALYVENWTLAGDSVDYLAQNNNIASPVQHYWSLSVEEQFYLLWPLLLLLGWWLARQLARRSPEHARTVIALVLGLVFTASLAASVVHTAWQPGPAYFGTHTRAWEFAAGGLLALFYQRTDRHNGLRTFASWIGLAAIAATMFLYNGATPFPGYTALLPVVGTALVIAAGNPAGRLSPRPLLELQPAQYLGDISYSLYLWHWPLIIFAPALLWRESSSLEKVGILAIAIVLSGLTKRFVEDPVRRSPLLGIRRPRVTLLPAAGAMAAIVVFGLIATSGVEQRLQLQQVRSQAAPTSSECLGAGTVINPSCSAVDLGDDIIPGTDIAPTDDVNSIDCWSRNGDDSLKVCSEGPESGAALRVALVGDSHSNQYLASLKALASDQRWHFDVYGKTGCIWTAAKQENDAAWVQSCESWKHKLNRRLAEAKPYDVIITSYSAASPIRRAEGKTLERTIIDGFVSVWEPLTAKGTPIVAIRDNPHPRGDYLLCIDRNIDDPAESCSISKTDAFQYYDGQPQAVDEVDGAHLLDLTEYFCQRQICSPVIGNVIVYRDPTHVTSTYARTLAPVIRDGVLQLTGLKEALATAGSGSPAN